MKNASQGGIVEERGESTCSSKQLINVFSESGNSSMYPRLNDTSNVSGARKSAQIIETVGNQQLETTKELKMPPVSTAVAQKRTRKFQ